MRTKQIVLIALMIFAGFIFLDKALGCQNLEQCGCTYDCGNIQCTSTTGCAGIWKNSYCSCEGWGCALGRYPKCGDCGDLCCQTFCQVNNWVTSCGDNYPGKNFGSGAMGTCDVTTIPSGDAILDHSYDGECYCYCTKQGNGAMPGVVDNRCCQSGIISINEPDGKTYCCSNTSDPSDSTVNTCDASVQYSSSTPPYDTGCWKYTCKSGNCILKDRSTLYYYDGSYQSKPLVNLPNGVNWLGIKWVGIDKGKVKLKASSDSGVSWSPQTPADATNNTWYPLVLPTKSPNVSFYAALESGASQTETPVIQEVWLNSTPRIKNVTIIGKEQLCNEVWYKVFECASNTEYTVGACTDATYNLTYALGGLNVYSYSENNPNDNDNKDYSQNLCVDAVTSTVNGLQCWSNKECLSGCCTAPKSATAGVCCETNNNIHCTVDNTQKCGYNTAESCKTSTECQSTCCNTNTKVCCVKEADPALQCQTTGDACYYGAT